MNDQKDPHHHPLFDDKQRAVPDFDDLDIEYDEDQYENRLLKWMSGGFMLAALAGFVWLAWWAYQSGTEPLSEDEIPLVESTRDPVKAAPEEPGGWKFAHQDKSVYNQLAGDGSERPVAERLMPAPEEPVQRPSVEEILAQSSREAVKSEPTVETLIAPEETPAPAPVEEAPAVVEVPEEKPVAEAVPVVTEVASAKAPEKTVKVMETPEPVKPAASAPKPAAPVSAAKAGQFMVQLGAFRSAAEAEASWKKISAAHGSMLPTKRHHVERADLGEKGVFHRLQVGPFDSDVAARKLCEYFQQQKQGCFVVKGR